MQQKMRPYPQPGCMQHKGLRQLCNLQLGQQHYHHYITSPRQISALLCSSLLCAALLCYVCECVCVCFNARARQCHICLAELEQMCARGLPLTSCPSARPGHAPPLQCRLLVLVLVLAQQSHPLLDPLPICSYYARSRIITVRNYHSPLATRSAQLAPFVAVRR